VQSDSDSDEDEEKSDEEGEKGEGDTGDGSEQQDEDLDDEGMTIGKKKKKKKKESKKDARKREEDEEIAAFMQGERDAGALDDGSAQSKQHAHQKKVLTPEQRDEYAKADVTDGLEILLDQQLVSVTSDNPRRITLLPAARALAKKKIAEMEEEQPEEYAFFTKTVWALYIKHFCHLLEKLAEVR
jgi:hypothetical protein